MASPSYLPSSDLTDADVAGSPADNSSDASMIDSDEELELMRHPTLPFTRPIRTTELTVNPNHDNMQPRRPGLFQWELTPIEQSAPRRYIRIAMALPFCRRGGYSDLQLREAHLQVTEAFFQTVRHWPWLAGTFCPSTEDSTKVKIVYRKNLGRGDIMARIESEIPNENWARIRRDTYHMGVSKLRKPLFVWKGDSEDCDMLFPVTIKTSLIDDNLVLGFSFSENIFDGESIKNFFCQFMKNTVGPDLQQEQASGRIIPPILDCRPNLDLLPCYDFTDMDIEDSTPHGRLKRGIVTLCPNGVDHLRKRVCEIIEREGIQGVALIEDCVFALFWVLIMRARYENHKITNEDICRANIIFPGFGHIRSPDVDVEYIGNSTATVIAAIDPTELIHAPVDPNNGLPRRMQHEDIALAAVSIRDALRSFDTNTFRHLGAAKRDVDPASEKRAYARALKRCTDSLVFEDWTCYAAGRGVDLPYVRRSRPCFFPCWDDVLEGTVVILPRRSDRFSKEKWHIYVCLDQEDFGKLINDLNVESWLLPDDT